MKLIKRFWPFLFIISIWFIFASPYFLQSKVPFSSTYLVNFFSPWNAYPGFSGPVKNNAMPDVISQIYPWKTFTIEALKNFQIPLWNSYSFSGTAHLANYQSGVLSPFNALFFLLPFIDAWSILVLLQPLLAGLFMYLYLQTLQIRKTPSTFGSIAFMFCGFITTWMGYATLGYAIIFLPLALYAIEKFYKTQKFKYLLLFSATLPLSFFSGHFQISLYFLIFICLYLVFKFLETKEKTKTLYSFYYLLFGLFLTTPQLLPSIEAYTQSFRSTIFEKAEIIPWGYLATIFAPDFLGNPVTRNDWFGHYAEWNGFVGTITIVLSFYGVLFNRNKKIYFFILTALFSILLSFQSPIIDLIVLLKIPVLSTSAASRVIVLFSFSIIVLSSLGLDYLIEDLKKNKIKQIILWLSLGILIFVLLWAIVIFKLFIPIEKIIIARHNLILPTIMLISLTIVVTCGFFLVKVKKLNKFIIFLPFALLILVSFDMLRFVTKWQPFDPRHLVFPQIPVETEFKKMSGYERVFGNLGTEAIMYYKLSSIEGYDAVYNKRYGQFMTSVKNGNVGAHARSVVIFPKYGLYSQGVLNLLGVKYLIHKIADGYSPWTFPFWNDLDTFKLTYNDGVYQIYENLRAFPRTFLVNNIKVQKDPQEIINAMYLDNTDLSKTVVLEENPNIKLNMKKGSAHIKNYSPNYIKIDTLSDGSAVLFLSDVYYPGWKAYVDGNQTQVYRADFTFRSIIVPKGTHSVTFVYDPISFKLGLFFAGIGIILIFVTFALRGKTILFPKI